MAITFDNAAYSNPGPPTVTVALTIGGGSDRAVVLVVFSEAGSDPDTVITSCTFDGVAMLPGAEIIDTPWRGSMFYLLEADLPAAGTYNAVVTISAFAYRHKAAVLSFAGVGGAPEATASAVSGSSSSSSTLPITTLTNNAWIVDLLYSSVAVAPTASSPLVSAASDISDFRTFAAGYAPTTTAGSNGSTWTSAGWTDQIRLSLALPEASGAPTGTGAGALAPFGAAASGTVVNPDAGFVTWRRRRAAPRQILYGSKSALTTVAGRLSSLWRTAPGAGAVPSSAAAPDKDTLGALTRLSSQAAMLNSSGVHRIVGARASSGQPGRLVLIDRLSHQGGLSGTVTTAQTTNLPTAALTRYASGVGVRAALEIHTQIGTTATTFTVTYTDDAGNTGQVSPAAVIGGTGNREASRFIEIPLLAGDLGVEAVADVDLLATTGTAGAFGVVLYKPLLSIAVGPKSKDWDPMLDAGMLAPEIVADACLQWLWIPYTTTTGGVEAELLLAED